MSGVYMQGQSPNERDTTTRDLVAVLFKYKWLILSITFAVLAAVLFKTFTSPVTFTADSTLMLDRQGERASILERSAQKLPWVEVAESEVQVLQSTPVLQGAVAILRAEAEAAGEKFDLGVRVLSKSIKTGVVGESNVLYVSATARDPETAVSIANAVAQSYQAYHREFFRIPDPTGYLQSRADSTYAMLQESETRRKILLDRVGLTDIVEQQRSMIRERSLLHGHASAKALEIAKLQTQIDDAERGLRDGVLHLPFGENTGTYQGQNMNQVARDYEIGGKELMQLRQKYTEAHPQVVQLKDRVDQMHATLVGWVEHVILIKRHELRVVRAEAEEVASGILELDKTLSELPQLDQELAMLDQKIEVLSNQYSEFSESVVSAAVNSGSFREYGAKLLSPAVSARRNAKGDPVRLALGPILALMAGIGLAFYLENLDHSLRNREDLEQHLDIPVLASFPDVDISGPTEPSKPRPRIPFQKKGRG